MRRRVQSILSVVLLLTSATLLAIVAILYFRDRDDPGEPPRPTAVPGHYQLIDVLDALNDAGLKTSIGGPTSGVRSTALEAPGQLLTAGNGQIYVFVYPDIGTQESSTLDVEAADVDLTSVSGDPIETTGATLLTKSNIAVLILNLDQASVAKAQKAVQDLP